MNKIGKLIVVTGLDASGKETQTRLLEERFDTLKRISFPNYDEPTGKVIREKLLSGAIPNEIKCAKDAYTVYEFAKLYTADRRFTMSDETILNHLVSGGSIICDRYSESNLIHQATKFKHEDKSIEVKLREIAEVNMLSYEHDMMKVRRPDLTIFLSVSPETTMKLLNKRGEQKDSQESDFEYIKSAYENSFRLCKLYGYKMINCERDGELRSIADIHNELVSIVESILNEE